MGPKKYKNSTMLQNCILYQRDKNGTKSKIFGTFKSTFLSNFGKSNIAF